MTNYRRGADFERKVAQALEACGAFVVRSAGSHGPVDLVALWPTTMMVAWLIQVKINGTMTPAERAELWRIAGRYHAVPVQASRPGRGKIEYRQLLFPNGPWATLDPIPYSEPGGPQFKP